jgi:hypothetical protein
MDTNTDLKDVYSDHYLAQLIGAHEHCGHLSGCQIPALARQLLNARAQFAKALTEIGRLANDRDALHEELDELRGRLADMTIERDELREEFIEFKQRKRASYPEDSAARRNAPLTAPQLVSRINRAFSVVTQKRQGRVWEEAEDRVYMAVQEWFSALAQSLSVAECGQPYPCGHAPDGGNHPSVATSKAMD